MKQIIDVEIIDLINDQNILNEGKKIFNGGDYSNPIILHENESFKVNSIIQNYDISILVSNNLLSSWSCTCDGYKFENKMCKHIVCGIQIYNECIKHNMDSYKNSENVIFNVHPIISKDEKNQTHIKILLSFGLTNYKKISILNINNLFKDENEFVFFANYGFKKEQIDSESLKILNDFKFILEKTNNNNAKNFIEVNHETLTDWMDFFVKYNIQLCWETEDRWLLSTYFFGDPKYDWDVNTKPNLNSKKKYILRTNRDVEYFSFLSKQKVYLVMLNVSKSEILIYEYDIKNETHVNNFIEFINKQVSKNNFYRLYLAIKELFWNYEKIINSIYVIQHGLKRIDPLLEIKVYYHEALAVLAAKMSFIYDDKIYPYKENELNYFKRERFLEKKLLEEALEFFPYYNKEHEVFELIDHQKLLDFTDWSKRKEKDEYFSIKISENLVFKHKKRKKFTIQGAKFDNDFLKIEWALEDFSDEDMKRIIAAYVKKMKYVTLTSNREINIEANIDMSQFEEELALLNTSVYEMVDQTYSKISKHNSTFVSNLYSDKIDDSIKQDIHKLFNEEKVLNELPPNLKTILKDYQMKGYKWIKNILSLDAGGILADEMGLGKTIQALSILADIYYNKKTTLASLIVCPSSLVYNWQEEFKKFAPFTRVAVIDGNQTERYKILDNINKYDVIVTSYNLLNRDLEKYLEYDFYLEILDEAQRIKNHSTQVSKDVKAIKARFKFALTGTPIENNLSELWSIFDYLMPGYLHDYKTFKCNYEEKIMDKQNNALEKLKYKIDPFILRRTKKDVLKELPEKSIKILTCDFNDEQKELYFTELNKTKIEIKSNLENKKEIGNNNAWIFSVLTKLRQICCSPKLIYENCNSNGSKFGMCMELIEDLIDNGSRILLFSQFTKMIDIIADELKRRNILFYTLTGDQQKKERLELVTNFNNKPHIKVFLISLKAGGVGLTLTSADTVIHYDPWWNSSLENQATDRAHRIGQKKNVNIYKLISKNSIEEKVLKLQESKTEIFNQIFDNIENKSKTSSKGMSMEDILNVLDISTNE